MIYSTWVMVDLTPFIRIASSYRFPIGILVEHNLVVFFSPSWNSFTKTTQRECAINHPISHTDKTQQQQQPHGISLGHTAGLYKNICGSVGSKGTCSDNDTPFSIYYHLSHIDFDPNSNDWRVDNHTFRNSFVPPRHNDTILLLLLTNNPKSTTHCFMGRIVVVPVVMIHLTPQSVEVACATWLHHNAHAKTHLILTH